MSRLLLSALVALGVGCASTGATGSADAPGRADSPGMPLGPSDNEPMLMRGNNITGPYTSLSLVEGGIRGRYANEPLDLQWTSQDITGTVSGVATHIQLTPEGGATLIHGSFGGLAVDFRLEGPWLSGRFGRCNYETERTSEGFVGRRSCSGKKEQDQIRVLFPEDLAKRPTREELGLLVLAFANDAPWNHKTMRPPQGTRSNNPYAPAEFIPHQYQTRPCIGTSSMCQ